MFWVLKKHLNKTDLWSNKYICLKIMSKKIFPILPITILCVWIRFYNQKVCYAGTELYTEAQVGLVCMLSGRKYNQSTRNISGVHIHMLSSPAACMHNKPLTLKVSITTATEGKFCDILPSLQKKNQA